MMDMLIGFGLSIAAIRLMVTPPSVGCTVASTAAEYMIMFWILIAFTFFNGMIVSLVRRRWFT